MNFSANIVGPVANGFTDWASGSRPLFHGFLVLSFIALRFTHVHGQILNGSESGASWSKTRKGNSNYYTIAGKGGLGGQYMEIVQ